MPWYWHAALFNVFWFCCVVFGNIAAPLIIVFFIVYRKTWQDRRFFLSASIIAMIACAIDYSFAELGWIQFREPPFWLMALWFGFLLSYRAVYAPLLQRPLTILVLLGAVFGPLCYRAGAAFGALTVLQPLVYLCWIPLWAIYFGCLTRQAK